MATLLDTSAFVAFLRRRAPVGTEAVREAALAAIRGRSAVVAAVTVTELLVGARDQQAARTLKELLDRHPVVAGDRDIAELAGELGRAARSAGQTLPLADLMIAATAIYLDIPLLTCDSDFARGRALAARGGDAGPWRGFELHAASSVG